MTRNQIDYFKAKEDKRHNLASEAETNRSNVAREQETNRSNLALERETNRHNLATEGIQTQANVINQAHLERMDTETHRSNVAREEETNRHNVMSERQQAAELAETARHNKTTENLTYVHNAVTEGIERDRVTAYKGSVEASQQQADTASKLAEATIAKTQSDITRGVYQNRLDAARTEQVYSQMDLADQENVREWWSTYTNALMHGSQAVENATDALGNIINIVPKIAMFMK